MGFTYLEKCKEDVKKSRSMLKNQKAGEKYANVILETTEEHINVEYLNIPDHNGIIEEKESELLKVTKKNLDRVLSFYSSIIESVKTLHVIEINVSDKSKSVWKEVVKIKIKPIRLENNTEEKIKNFMFELDEIKTNLISMYPTEYYREKGIHK